MARRDKNQDEAPESEESDAVAPPEEEADGYRPSRRQQTAKKDAKRAAAPKEPEKPVSQTSVFLEQHWESWLQPVLLLVVLGAGFLGYRFDLIPETVAGLCAAGGVVLVAIYAVSSPAMDLIAERKHRILFGLLVALWAISSGVPALRKGVPRPVIGEAVLTEAQKSAKVSIAGGKTGPFDITVSGKIQPSGAQQTNASYVINVTASGGAADVLEGELEYSVHQTRSRRGNASHWTDKHDQVVHRLSPAVRGGELTLVTESIDDLLQDGLHILVHPQDLLLPLLLPKLGEQQIPVLGILIVLVMIFLETRLGDAKNKPYLVMASMMTMIFSWRFSMRATSTNLVPPAVEAFLVALIVGGIGGTFLGWAARQASGRARLRPPKADEKKGKSDDEE